MRTKLRLILLSSLALFALAAACGDDDTATPATRALPTADGTPEAVATGRDATAATASVDWQSDPKAVSELRAMVEGLSKTTYHANYDLKGSDRGGSTIEATVVLASRPPASLFALSGAKLAGSIGGNVALINDDKFSYLCLDSSGTKQCLKNKADATSVLTQLPLVFNIDVVNAVGKDPNLRARSSAGQRIGGIQGKCWEVANKDGTGILCASDQPVLLLIDGTFTGAKVRIQAKDVSGDAPAKEFEPPYPVIDITGGR